jgi:NAD(P)-dependent dehydrogenase (short-subunit alcohol dehydrogenase family)
VRVCTLEPGGIRTSWARRAGQNLPDLLPEYEAAVGPILKLLHGIRGQEEGDPRKIAEVVLKLANSDAVPLRLILGVGAEKWVQNAEDARAKEAANWRQLTLSTVFADAEPIPELLSR